MKIHNLIILFFTGALVISCAKVNYLGKTYSPTTNVDVFLDANEITREYELMGEAIVKSAYGNNTEKMLEKAKEKAMKVGADAILVGELEEVVVSTNTTQNSNFNNNQNGANSNTTTQTSEQTQLRVKINYLKYK